MKCPGCNVDVQLGEKFCKSCGAELPQDPEAPVKSTDPTAADKMRNAGVQTENHVEEKDLWEGRYSVLEAGGWWVLTAILLLAVVVFYLVEIVGGLKGSNTFLIIGICVAALVFLLGTVRHVHGWLTNKFKITTQRVFYIQGLSEPDHGRAGDHPGGRRAVQTEPVRASLQRGHGGGHRAHGPDPRRSQEARKQGRGERRRSWN